MSELLTIGYTEPDAMPRIAAFLASERAGLVDIRLKPHSRWYPAFNKKALIEQFSLKYGHCPELGNLHYRPEDREKGIKIADPNAGVRRVLRLLDAGVDVMLLCACKDYEQCHRKVVYELIVAELGKARMSELAQRLLAVIERGPIEFSDLWAAIPYENSFIEMESALGELIEADKIERIGDAFAFRLVPSA